MMGELKVATTTGSKITLDEATIESFKGSLRGELYLPSDSGYDDARKLYNAMIDKRPAFIIQCAGVADVIAAINLGKGHQLLTSIRGTGHNITGNAVCDDGMTIDLSQMKGMRIDVSARTVRAEPGLTWGELNHDLQAFGLQATGGFISTTGIGGLSLGGGLGWLIRKHGLACDNLLEVDIVTADGNFVTANAENNTDLFWAVRGGGGNFGVITSFKFRVHPVGVVLAGMLGLPIGKVTEAMQFWRDYSTTAPEELTSGMALLTAPPASFIPEEIHGSLIGVVAGVYCGEVEEGEKIIQPFRENASPPLFDIFQPMPGANAQSFMDTSFPWGFRNYWKSSIMKVVTDDAIDVMLTHFAKVPSPMSMVIVEHNGDGAINRVSPSETAVGHRDWSYDILICSLWENPVDDEMNIKWARDFWDAMQPFARDAVYVNYLGDEGSERVKAAYAAEVYERLVQSKNKYDPTNFFRFNQNIVPTM